MLPVHRQDAGGPLVVERYHLGEKLGRGNFGVVRVAVRASDGGVVACKTIPRGNLLTPEAQEDLDREVSVMASLPCHPALPRLHEVYADAGGVHLVMDLCDRGPLSDWMAARAAPGPRHGRAWEAAAAAVARMVVAAADALHAAAVMHRDLKPANLMRCSAGGGDRRRWRLVAVDFGLAVRSRPGDRLVTGAVGTLEYAAPEVLDGNRSYGPSADVWSVGVIVYELLAGRHPFPSDGSREGQRRVIGSWRGAPDLRPYPWPYISRSAQSLVLMLLEADPDMRPTARQVLDHPWLKGPAATV